jgi:hypothetical protein
VDQTASKDTSREAQKPSQGVEATATTQQWSETGLKKNGKPKSITGNGKDKPTAVSSKTSVIGSPMRPSVSRANVTEVDLPKVPRASMRPKKSLIAGAQFGYSSNSTLKLKESTSAEGECTGSTPDDQKALSVKTGGPTLGSVAVTAKSTNASSSTKRTTSSNKGAKPQLEEEKPGEDKLDDEIKEKDEECIVQLIEGIKGRAYVIHYAVRKGELAILKAFAKKQDEENMFGEISNPDSKRSQGVASEHPVMIAIANRIVQAVEKYLGIKVGMQTILRLQNS